MLREIEENLRKAAWLVASAAREEVTPTTGSEPVSLEEPAATP